MAPSSRGEIVSNMQTLVFTVPQLAALVAVHPDTIRRAIAAGELRAANSGGKTHYRVSRMDAEAWWRARGGGSLFVPGVPAPSPTPDRTAAILAVRGAMRRPTSDGRMAERFMSEKHADNEREDPAH